jgi:phage terminase small subunit
MSLPPDPSDALSEMQMKFVRYYVEFGGVNGTKAALLAGYSPGVKNSSAAISASRLLRKPLILSEIRRETERSLKAGVALGARALIDLAKSAKSESVKLQAATALLDRGGMQLKALQETTVIVEDRRTNDEILKSIEALSRELGVKTIEGKIIEIPPPTIEHMPIEMAGIDNSSADEMEGSIFD